MNNPTNTHEAPTQSHRLNNPWKGLDSYQETDRLYGRDEEIELLFSRIEYNIQTVVYSRSGIGKSSIINAGIFPKARQAGMLPVGIRLQHTTDKRYPNTPYIEQVRHAVESALQASGGRIEEVVPHTSSHEETLWEYLHRYRFWLSEDDTRPVVPLLVFDQFEEIFTLEKDHHHVTDFFEQVADLLNGIMPEYLSAERSNIISDPTGTTVNRSALFRGMRERQRNHQQQYIQEDNFRIVFTLREDYLSYLERNTTLIPSLKLNRYCLLPINEEQAATIIMDPRPGLVDKDVAILIIQKITGETDFQLDGRPAIFVDSAILSLYLSRLYAMIPEGEDKITAELVNTFGDNIIQDFYLEACSGISEKSVEYLEDNLLNNEGRRENISVYNAKHIGGLTDKELTYLCEEKKLLRRFAYSGDMRLEYIHDILCPIIKDRRDLRLMMRAQEEERRKIIEKERHKRELLELKAKADRRHYRQRLWGVAVLLLVVVGAWIYHQWMNEWESHAYYENFIQVNGWPVGVGPELSESKALNRSVCYKLKKQGHRSDTPFTEVEVTTPDGLLHNTRGNQLVDGGEGHDEKAAIFKRLLKRTMYYVFRTTQTGDSAKVTKMEMLDKDKSTLFVVTYFDSTEDHETTHSSRKAANKPFVWAVFTDAMGAPLQVCDNGADRMQIFLDANGKEEKYMFFDSSGAPCQNDMDYYGYRAHYDAQNHIDSIWILNPFSEAQFMELHQYTDSSMTTIYTDLSGKPINHQSLGYHRRVAISDPRGNIVHKEYFDASGGYVNPLVRSAIVDFEFDEMNRRVLTLDYDGEGKPYTQNPKFYPRREYCYVGNTLELLSERDYRWDPLRKQMYEVKRFVQRPFGSVAEYKTINFEKGTYRMKRVERNENYEPISVSYYGKDDNPVIDSIEQFHKHIIEERINADGLKIVVHRYYNVKGELFSAPGYRDYAIDSCTYSAAGELLGRVCYDSDTTIVKSQGYEYRDGVEVARYALGIHGQPIRCPQWERDGLCYYRLQNVKSMDNILTFVKPMNEYGTLSWAYDGNDPWGISETRDQNLITTNMGGGWKRETITMVYADHIPIKAPAVAYVHLTRKDCTADRIGLRDGDLLLSIGNWQYTPSDDAVSKAQKQWSLIGTQPMEIRVARFHQRQYRWQILTFSVPRSHRAFGCEIYPIYYTDEEFRIFNKIFEQ